MSKADRPQRAPRAQTDVFHLAATRAPATARAEAAYVTPAGADWLASASVFPRSVHALWRLRPTAPSVLPCGAAFDVVSTTPLHGRSLLDRLWSQGPGSGPVAVHRGRMLLFAAPGTAHRLPALLGWEEWQDGPGPARSEAEPAPSLLCHGPGDAVTVPALQPSDVPAATAGSRWLVAPDVRDPWLPGPEDLLRACLSAARAAQRVTAGAAPTCPSVAAGRKAGGDSASIFVPAAGDATVYDVSRRR